MHGALQIVHVPYLFARNLIVVVSRSSQVLIYYSSWDCFSIVKPTCEFVSPFLHTSVSINGPTVDRFPDAEYKLILHSH